MVPLQKAPVNAVSHPNPWVARFAGQALAQNDNASLLGVVPKPQEPESPSPFTLPSDRLTAALSENPPLVSSAVHGGFGVAMGTAAGMAVGALTGLVWLPAHVGAIALAGGVLVGAAAAAHGWNVGDRVREQIGLPQSPPTPLEMVSGQAHDMLTTSTGSLLVDAAIGGLVGYALVPSIGWVLAGILLVGLAGLGGVALLVGGRLVQKQIRPAKPT